MSGASPEDRLAIAGFFPISLRTHLHAENLTNIINDLVNDINAVDQSLGAGSGQFVTMKQLRLALASQSNLVTVDEAVPASVENTTNIYWNHGNTSNIGDPLWTFINSTLGQTVAQTNALYALALTFPP